VQGPFFIIQRLLNRGDTKGTPYNHSTKCWFSGGSERPENCPVDSFQRRTGRQAPELVAPGKLSGGQFSAENGLAGPGTGGGALNKLFAKCTTFALLAAMQR